MKLTELTKKQLMTRIYNLKFHTKKQHKIILRKNRQILKMRQHIHRIKILIENKDKEILRHLRYILNRPFSRIFKR
jgi:hypothetical protein